MVRFARADGSKGSNKRQLEEATPWIEMVKQIENNKKKKSKKKLESRRDDDGTLGETMKKKKIKLDDSEQSITSQNTLQHIKKQNSEAKKEESNEPTQTTQDLVKKRKKEKKGLKTKEPEYTITSEGKRVKVFRDGTQRTWFDLPYEESDLMTRYEGMWVKQEMVDELDRLKATLEEEGLGKEEMMRKMMKAKRKAHRQLRIELIYQQKKLVNEATGEEVKDGTTSRKVKEIKKSNGITSTKKKKNLIPVIMTNESLFSQRKIYQVDTGKGECNLENVSAKELLSTKEQLEESSTRKGMGKKKELVTNQASVKVKKKKIKDTDGKIKEKKSTKGNKLKNSMTPPENDTEGNSKGGGNMEATVTHHDDTKQIKISKEKLKVEDAVLQSDKQDSNKGRNEEITTEVDDIVERKSKKCMFEEVAAPLQDERNDNNHSSKAEECNPVSRKNLSQSHGLNKTTENTSSHWVFEENELMTNYDGYWVLREDVEYLEAAKKTELGALYAARTDVTVICERDLTKEEQLVLQRAMKKKKRFHHRKLLGELSKMGKRVSDTGKRKGNDKGKVKKDDSNMVVKFDGFWVKKEAADRLRKLRQKLHKEGLSQQEVDSLVQKERRKEERVLKNERKLVCLNCRQPGHMVSACPNIVQAEGEGQPSICYICGSTEHTSATCNLKKGSEKSYSFATCYICKESGHISRQCPDNPRGLYPKGGACRGCGSVEHLAKDCPDLQKEKGESILRVGRLKGEELEVLAAEEEEPVDDGDEASSHIKWNIPKVVKF